MDREQFCKAMTEPQAIFSAKDREKIIENSIKAHAQDNLSKAGNTNCIIVMEELAELSTEISKYLRGKENRAGIIEEMADVEIGNMYLQQILGISDETIQKAIDVKLQREKNRTDNN